MAVRREARICLLYTSNEPMIYIKSAELRHLLRLSSSYARLTDLFEGQNYRLQELWKGGQKPHMKMTSLEKAIMETDEKVGLILMLRLSLIHI